MVPEDVSHLCVCWTCHIWSLRLWNQHHHWIHIEKWFPKMYHTCICQTCHIRSLWSWNWHHHWIHVKKWFPKMMRTPWGLHRDCKIQPGLAGPKSDTEVPDIVWYCNYNVIVLYSTVVMLLRRQLEAYCNPGRGRLKVLHLGLKEGGGVQRPEITKMYVIWWRGW